MPESLTPDVINRSKSAVARRSDQAGHWHGETVPDPYQRLENSADPETTAWVTAQNELYIGQVASLLGTWMSAVAVTFAVLGGGGSADGLGVVMAAEILPQVMFVLGGGVLADRIGRRPVMLGADAGARRRGWPPHRPGRRSAPGLASDGIPPGSGSRSRGGRWFQARGNSASTRSCSARPSPPRCRPRSEQTRRSCSAWKPRPGTAPPGSPPPRPATGSPSSTAHSASRRRRRNRGRSRPASQRAVQHVLDHHAAAAVPARLSRASSFSTFGAFGPGMLGLAIAGPVAALAGPARCSPPARPGRCSAASRC